MVWFLSLLFYSVVFTIASFFALYYVIFLRRVAKWKESNIPYLQPLFLVGHEYLLDLKENALAVALDRIYRENSDKELVAFFIGIFPVIFVRDHNLYQKIVRDNFDKTFRNYFFIPEDDVETQSMSTLSSDKVQWKVARAAMAPTYSTLRLGGAQFSKFKKHMERMWRYLEEARLAGQPISVMDFAHSFVADSTSLWNFGEETNSYEEKPELHAVVRDFFEVSVRRMVRLFVKAKFPFLQSYGVQVFKSLKIVQQKYVDSMRTFLKEKMEHRHRSEVKQGDLIDHFMSLRDKNVLKHRRENGDVLMGNGTDLGLRQMTGYALATLIAGTKPVSNLCLGTVHMLSLHPEHQDRIKNEIDDAMIKHNVSELTFEVIQDLPFTMNCVYETSRLIPLLMLNMRHCSEDFQIPGTSYRFRKGDVVITAPYSVHRDPKYFRDPDKFDPERFNLENRNSAFVDSFISFGHGHRKCPGYKIGVLQAVMFVASLVSKYEVRPRSHLKQMTAVDFHPRTATNIPKEELLIDIIPRNTQ